MVDSGLPRRSLSVGGLKTCRNDEVAQRPFSTYRQQIVDIETINAYKHSIRSFYYFDNNLLTACDVSGTETVDGWTAGKTDLIPHEYLRHGVGAAFRLRKAQA
jgi:hypothetical protein